jgi:hypothetical protein
MKFLNLSQKRASISNQPQREENPATERLQRKDEKLGKIEKSVSQANDGAPASSKFTSATTSIFKTAAEKLMSVAGIPKTELKKSARPQLNFLHLYKLNEEKENQRPQGVEKTKYYHPSLHSKFVIKLNFYSPCRTAAGGLTFPATASAPQL